MPGRRVPLFRTPATDREDGPAAWWQRREMLVALLHARCPDCAALRERLASQSAALRGRDAAEAVLELDGASAALAREVARSAGVEPEPVVVVADRYAEVFAAVPVHGAEAGAVLDEAEGWIEHIQQQCPE